MTNLKPLVYEMLYSIGDNTVAQTQGPNVTMPAQNEGAGVASGWSFKGNAKPMPMINCTAYSNGTQVNPFATGDGTDLPGIQEKDVPAPKIVVGAIIVPPSRLHELFYRMVVEWTLEFSMIRPLSEITNWTGLEKFADITHYQNYDYETTKKVLTGDSDTILDSDTSLATANVGLNKVM